MSLTFRWTHMDHLDVGKKNEKILKTIKEEVVPKMNGTTDLRAIATVLVRDANLTTHFQRAVMGLLKKGRVLKSNKRGMDALKKAKMAIREGDKKENIYKLLSFARRHCASHDENIAVLLEKHNPYKATPATMPMMEERNKEFPVLSQNVRIAATKGSPRRLIAEEVFYEGDTIMVEPAFQFVIQPGYEMYFCDGCGLKIASFFPCVKCSEVVYCSESCRSKVSSVHEYECGYIGMFARAGYSTRLLLKSLLSTDSKQLGLAEANQTLRYNKAKDTFELLSLGAYVMGVLHFMKITTNYFKDATEEDIIQTAHHLLIVQLQICANVFALDWYYSEPISEARLDEDLIVIRRSSKHQVGIGVFLMASLLNHSCDPNVYFRFSGSRAIGVAKKYIEMGEELVYCYGAHYKVKNRQYRQEYLLEKFGVICNCPACRQPFEATNIYLDAILCPNCMGPSLLIPDSVNAKCVECGEYQCLMHPKVFEVLDQVPLMTDDFLASLDNGLYALMSAWEQWQSVLYHTNHNLIRLARALRNRFIICKEWYYAFRVSKALISPLSARFSYPCPEVVVEMRILTWLARSAASAIGYQNPMAEFMNFNPIWAVVRTAKYSQPENQPNSGLESFAVRITAHIGLKCMDPKETENTDMTETGPEIEILMRSITKYNMCAAAEQARLCGINELEMDTAPLFIDSQYS